MKLNTITKTFILTGVIALSTIFQQSQASGKKNDAQAAVRKDVYQEMYIDLTYKKLFVRNDGQLTNNLKNPIPEVIATIDIPGFRVYFKKDAVSYVVHKNVYDNTKVADTEENDRPSPSSVTLHRFDVEFAGANPSAKVILEQEAETKSNFYLPNCKNGILNVPMYNRIRYENIFPNVDFVFYSNSASFLKYDIIVYPGADVASIKLKYKGANNIFVENNTKLHIGTSAGDIEDALPHSYLYHGGKDKNIDAQVLYAFDGASQTVSFKTEQSFKNEIVVIDPWSTYFGGAADDKAFGSCVDGSGNQYSIGNTFSSTFPNTVGAFQTTFTGTTDAILYKINSTGTLVWSTYIGGGADQQGNSVSMDNAGNVFICGWTSSTDFPVSTSPYQNSNGGGTFDAFVGKFNSSGARQWLTYMGNASTDQAFAIAGDNLGNAFVTGATTGTFIPMLNQAPNASPLQTVVQGSTDCFLVKFNSSGALQYSSYFGGAQAETGTAIAVDASNNVYFTGFTTSTASTFPVLNATQGGLSGNNDVFVAKFNNNCAQQWTTYYGGPNADRGYGITVSPAGSVYVSGYAAGSFATFGSPYQALTGGSNDFILMKFTTAGAIQWATYIGGTGNDQCTSVAYDGQYVYAAGFSGTQGTFPMVGTPFQSTWGTGNDVVLAKFDTLGAPSWTTFYGGSGDDRAQSVAAFDINSVYVAGFTSSTNFPTTTPLQAANAGSYDAVNFKMNANGTMGTCAPPPPVSAGTITGLTSVCTGTNGVTYSISTVAGATSYTWNITGGSTIVTGAGTNSITVNIASPSGTLSVTANNACGSSPPSTLGITVNTPPVITVQPSAQSGCTGGTVVFCVTATGGGLSYQWNIGAGVLIDAPPHITGATTSCLTITNIVAGDFVANYNVTVSGTCPSPVTSNLAALTSGGGVSITTQPSNVTVCAPASASFTVAAAGSGLTYQWFKGVTLIPSATSATYTINPTASTDAGTYSCAVTSTCGTTNSNNATLTVNSAPVITVQPTNQATCLGGTVNFCVTATGTTLTYQWYKGATMLNNTGNISGVTTSCLTITNVGAGDAAVNYNVIVTSAVCVPSVTSSNTTLTISSGPSITTQPSNQVICSGQDATFSVVSSGVGLSYQWRKGAVPVSGAPYSGELTPDLLITGALSAQAASNYNCVVSLAGCGSSTSSNASLTVNALPLANAGGADRTVCAGASTTLGVTAVIGNTYSWSPATDLSDASIAKPVCTPTGPQTYTLTETITLTGCSNSHTISIAVNPAPPIPVITQNADGSLQCDQAGCTYQWYFGVIVIAGATAQTYTPTINGDFTVKITCGGCTSSSTSFTVNTVGVSEIKDTENELIRFSPNPFHEKLSITSCCKSPVDILIFDALGREIFNVKDLQKSKEFDFTNMPDGIYFCKVIKDNKEVQIEKIIKLN